MAFGDYAEGASGVQRREWVKIQGRFEDIPFVDTPAQTRSLIAAAFEPADPPLAEALGKWVQPSTLRHCPTGRERVGRRRRSCWLNAGRFTLWRWRCSRTCASGTGRTSARCSRSSLAGSRAAQADSCLRAFRPEARACRAWVSTACMTTSSSQLRTWSASRLMLLVG